MLLGDRHAWEYALWADETTLDVLEVDKSTCYMWVYGCGVERSTGPKLVLFDYQDGRSGANAVRARSRTFFERLA